MSEQDDWDDVDLPVAAAGTDPFDDGAAGPSQQGDETGHGAGDEVEGTGNRKVDEAVEQLGVLDDLPTAQHADVFEDVHSRLQAALTDLDRE